MTSGRSSTLRRVGPYAIAGAAGLAVIVAAVLVVARIDRSPQCGVSLKVTSSTEKDNLLTKLAEAYNAKKRRLPSGDCAKAEVDGFTSGAAMDALAGGWTSDEARKHPKPHVWLPTSSMWAVQLREHDGYRDLPTDSSSIARSPVVIAMPRKMAEAIGWEQGKPFTWKEILGRDGSTWEKLGNREWGRFAYAKDDPTRSTSGLAATVATYYAGAGKGRDLQPGDVTSPKVEEFVRNVEANILFHPPDIMNFLKDLSDADKQNRAENYISAVVMQEELAYLYNEGNPDGDPSIVGRSSQPNMQLVAIHPAEGTLVLDHPYIILPSVTAVEREAATSFRDFLLEPEQREWFAKLGFRDDRDVPPPDLAKSLGFSVGHRPSLMEDPSAKVLDAIRSGWKRLSKRANVLVIVDESGSMKESSGIPGFSTRMDAAKAALRNNMKRLNPDDEVGLWAFASYPGTPYRTLLAPTRFGNQGEAFSKAIDRLRIAEAPYDDTALCVTIRNAHRYMLEHLKEESINAIVVLTDGVNDYPQDPCQMSTLGTQLADADRTHQVKVFGIGFGADAEGGMLVLKQVSKGPYLN